MNIIISILEFIVLVTSIGMFFAKREKTPDGEWNTNWGIAIIIATLLMIAMNIKFVCSGIYCFFTCAVDNTPGADSAKKAVAIYRRVKEGKKAELGFGGYGNVDLKHLNQDLEEENLFLGAETPEEIESIAKRATKTVLAQNLKDRQEATSKLVKERTDEFGRVVANRPKDQRVAGPSTPDVVKKTGFLDTAEQLYKKELGQQATYAKFKAAADAKAKAAKEAEAADRAVAKQLGFSDSIESASDSDNDNDNDPPKLKKD